MKPPYKRETMRIDEVTVMRSDFDPDETPLSIELKRGFGFVKTKIHLDPATQIMHVEQKKFWGEKKPIDIPFADISRIEKRTYASEGTSSHAIQLERRSGERLFLNGAADAHTTAMAVDAIKAFLQLTSADAAKTKLIKGRLQRGLLGISVILLPAFALYASQSYLFLPRCDDKEVLASLANLNKLGRLKVEDLAYITMVSDQSNVIVCQAVWHRTPGDKILHYRLYWRGWDRLVQIF